MSLSKLPDLVKSQICSFLDFNEIKKLEQTNKRIQYFLKRYKLDKPKIGYLCLDHLKGVATGGDNSVITCVLFDDKFGGVDSLPNIDYQEGQNTQTTNIINLLNKFHSIDYLYFCDINLAIEVEWPSVTTKIKSVNFKDVRFTASKGAVMNFFKIFKQIEFANCMMDPSFIDDELFTVLSGYGTTLKFEYMQKFLEVVLTDVTLDTLSIVNLPTQLLLDNLITKFTFGKIKSMIKAALTSSMNTIDWYLGIMREEQYYDVRRFMLEEFGELTVILNLPLYFEEREESTPDRKIFYIYHREKEAHEYFIGFEVIKPVEIILIEREMDEEPGNEDPMDV